MSIGLPGPLQAPFELKNDLPASSFTPDAATLALHALNLLKKDQTHQQNVLANLGGLTFSAKEVASKPPCSR